MREKAARKISAENFLVFWAHFLWLRHKKPGFPLVSFAACGVKRIPLQSLARPKIAIHGDFGPWSFAKQPEGLHKTPTLHLRRRAIIPTPSAARRSG
jgi:hypothetical protein